MIRQMHHLSMMVLLAAGTMLVGCTGPHGDVREGVAVLHPTKGHDVRGVVRFIEQDKGVRVVADVGGLKANLKHGFHVHEYGDCTAPDATSAGGHYDPDDTGHHAMLNAREPHHAGDLGNLQADAQGRARYDAVVYNLSVLGTDNPVVGRAVIVHAKPDDGGQPTGNAGPRAACGVVGIAEPK